MDFGDHSRVQNSFSRAASDQADTSLYLLRSREESTVGRDREAVGKTGNQFNTSQGWFHKQCVSCSEEGGPMEVDTEPEGLEHVYANISRWRIYDQ